MKDKMKCTSCGEYCYKGFHCPKCDEFHKDENKGKAYLLGDKGELKEFEMKLSEEAQKELDEIKKKVEADTKPLHDALNINPETHDLHWTNGEMFLINRHTGFREEIQLTKNKKDKEE